jgi:hypothetical protein
LGLSPVIRVVSERELRKVWQTEGDKSEVKGSEVLIRRLKYGKEG